VRAEGTVPLVPYRGDGTDGFAGTVVGIDVFRVGAYASVELADETEIKTALGIQRVVYGVGRV